LKFPYGSNAHLLYVVSVEEVEDLEILDGMIREDLGPKNIIRPNLQRKQKINPKLEINIAS
jgi:hypothetical protein